MTKVCDGRVAVVTGAGRGIGREHALMLAEQGARVIVNDLGGDEAGHGADLTPAQQVVAEIEAMGGEAAVNGANVADFDAAGEMVQQAIDTWGRIDILVNNAGLARGLGPVVDNSEQDWREMMETNVMGLMRMTRLFLPELQKREYSDLVQISSLAGVQPYANGAAYCASKAAVEAFSQALRQELPGTGVREFVIEP